MRQILALAIPILMPAAVAAQSVLRVGPTRAFTEIFSATSAAQSGDIILVDPGTYRGFNATKSLTIRVDPLNAYVEVSEVSMLSSIAPGPGEQIIVDGLTFAGEVDVFGDGAAAFSRTVFRDGLGVGNASVALTGCQLVAGDRIISPASGLAAYGSATVSAVQTNFDGGTHFFTGSPAVTAIGTSQLHFSSCNVVGGVESRLHHFVPQSGMILRDAARAWLVDTNVSGFPFSNFGGIPSGQAVINQGTGQVLVERGIYTSGSVPPTSPPTSGNVAVGFLLGLSTPTTHLQRGAPVQLDFRTRPGLPVAMHTALELGPAMSHPLLAQPEWGFSTNTVFFTFMLSDANGFASTSLNIPNVPEALHRSFWFTGWSASNLPAQMAPVLGGVVH